MDPREAEDGHDRVTDEFLDRPAVQFEDASHLVEVAAHHLTQGLGIDRLAKTG